MGRLLRASTASCLRVRIAYGAGGVSVVVLVDLGAGTGKHHSGLPAIEYFREVEALSGGMGDTLFIRLCAIISAWRPLRKV